MFIELLIPSNYLVLFCSCLQFFPASGSFLMSQFFASGGQSIEASISVLPMNIQDWFPLGLTDLTSLLSKGLSRVFSNTTVQKHQFFGAQPSLWSNSHIHTWPLEKAIALTIWTFAGKVMSLLFNMLSRLVIAFLPRSKCLLISWLQSPSDDKETFQKLAFKLTQPEKMLAVENKGGSWRSYRWHILEKYENEEV